MSDIVRQSPNTHSSNNLNTSRTIFRADALRRYVQSREQKVLPSLIAPRIFRYLWVLFMLLIAIGFIAASMSIPIYAFGSAVIVNQQDTSTLVAFLPPDILPMIQSEPFLYLQVDPTHERLRASIAHIEPQIISPVQARERFDLTSTASVVTRPSVVVIVELPDELSAPTFVGSLYPVEIQIGSQRLLSLLPLIGPWFE